METEDTFATTFRSRAMPEPTAPDLPFPLPFAAARQVDLLCDDFERAWEQGTPRPIEEVLRSADATWIPVLREELLRLELECRCQRGEQPPTDEYVERFPECAASLPAWLEQAGTAVNERSTVASIDRRSSTVDYTPGVETATPPPPVVGAPPRPPLHELGEYDLFERLGAGGMGEVYRARHRRLGKLVAVKVLRETRLTSPAALARFRREMEAVGSLDHPHLVEAHDAGEQDGVIYLVLKLIDGVDLQRLVKERGPLPVGEACELVRQAALGVQYLLERGLVHRDLKPSNLMRTPSGTVKVLDLGLARLRDSIGTDELTTPDLVLGTPDYLAPEQIENAAAVDIRADLYSLGATLFYLLTGKPPFAHRAPMLAKLKAHGYEAPPDVRSLRPEVPAAVAALVARLLAKRPEQRLATPQELAAALAPFTTPTGPVPRPRRHWGRVLAVAAGLLLLIPLVIGTMLSLQYLQERGGTGRPIDSVAPLPVNPVAEPTAVQPLKVVRLDVEHFARNGRPGGLLGSKSFVTRCDDQLTVEGELSAPAYCYLIAYRADGSEELCFPEKEEEVPPLTARPAYPWEKADVQIGLNEGPGLHAFVLVARSKPLPPYAEWRRQHGASPWKRSDAVVGVVWRFDGATLRGHTVEDPEARGKGQEVRGVGPLPRLAEWLRKETEAEAVSAVAFAVRPRE
jgi:serine/threonine protein kinase